MTVIRMFTALDSPTFTSQMCPKYGPRYPAKPMSKGTPSFSESSRIGNDKRPTRRVGRLHFGSGPDSYRPCISNE